MFLRIILAAATAWSALFYGDTPHVRTLRTEERERLSRHVQVEGQSLDELADSVNRCQYTDRLIQRYVEERYGDSTTYVGGLDRLNAEWNRTRYDVDEKFDTLVGEIGVLEECVFLSFHYSGDEVVHLIIRDGSADRFLTDVPDTGSVGTWSVIRAQGYSDQYKWFGNDHQHLRQIANED